MAKRFLRPIQTDDPENTGAPRWTLTFSDVMSQILVFFVMLFSMSTMDKFKYQESVQSMQKALLTKQQQELLEKTDFERLKEINEIINRKISSSDARNSVSTKFDKDGIRIIVKDSVFFTSGESDLLPGASPVLLTIANALSGYHFKILVEGHTDNIPISTEKYPSNWELSTARATNVVKYLISQGHLAPERLMATGFAEFRPLLDNNTDSHRARNRRVEIKVMTESG